MMRTKAPLVIVGLALAACSTPEDKLVGTWTGFDGTGKVTIEITRDRKIKNGDKVTPYWVKSIKDNTITIVSSDPAGELEEKLIVDGDKLRIRIAELGDRRELKLTRVPSP